MVFFLGERIMVRSFRKGQGVLEMALVLPLFIFVVLTIIDLSRGLHVSSALNLQCLEAARAGARRMNFFVATDMFGSHTHADFPSVKAAFERYKSPAVGRCDVLPAGSSFPSSPDTRVVYWVATGIGTSDKAIQVKAQCDIELFTPFMGSFFGPSRNTYRLTAENIQEKE